MHKTTVADQARSDDLTRSAINRAERISRGDRARFFTAGGFRLLSPRSRSRTRKEGRFVHPADYANTQTRLDNAVTQINRAA